MATADSVKAKLQGLIDKANDTTGGADADLTSAVDRLCDGYGSGESGGGEEYDGAYEVTPKFVAQTLPTAEKLMTKDLTIEEIPYAEVSNNSGGKTVIIG
jgi:hypothetical protein